MSAGDLCVGIVVGFLMAFFGLAWLATDYANDRVDWERLTRVREVCSATATVPLGRALEYSEPCREFMRFWEQHARNREGK